MSDSQVVIISITVGLIYVLILVLNFFRRNWYAAIRTPLIIAHSFFAALVAIDIILMLSAGVTFRGIYSDRIVFWGLFLTGALFFSLFKGKLLLSKIYFGIYLYYPFVAMVTFLIDRIMFVVVASPILVSLLVPRTYYSDDKFEIRDNTGVLGVPHLILIEKSLLIERQIGREEFVEEIKSLEVIDTSRQSFNVRLNYKQSSELVTIRISR